jgi:hypothetical protein
MNPDPFERVTAVRGEVDPILLPFADRLIGPGATQGADPAARAVVEPPMDLLAGGDPHDAFFRVARCHGDPAGAYRRALGSARSLLDAGDEGPAGAAPTAEVLQTTLDLLSQSPQADWPDPTSPPDLPASVRTLEQSVRRWLRGHQVFAVITQGLILAVDAFDRAWVSGVDDATLRRHLRALTALYGATAWAMRHASDFPRQHYDEAIRIAMSEPHAPAGFSGALSTDHGVLVRRIGAARAAFDATACRLPREHAALKAALAAMYEDHKRVCARLAGLERPSIRSSTMTSDRHSAGELLDRFRDRRVQLLR